MPATTDSVSAAVTSPSAVAGVANDTTLNNPTAAELATAKSALAAVYRTTGTPQKIAAVAATAATRTVTATFKTISSTGSATTVGTMSWNLTLGYHYDLTATFPLIVIDKNKAATLWDGKSTIPTGSTLYVADINGYYKNRLKTYFLSADSTASSTIATVFVTPANDPTAKTYTTAFEAVTNDNNTPVAMWSVTGVNGTTYDYRDSYQSIQAQDSSGTTRTYYLVAADADKLVGTIGNATQIVTLHYSLYTSNATVSVAGSGTYTGKAITQADLVQALTGTGALDTSGLTLSDFQFLNQVTGATALPQNAGTYVVGLTDAGKAKLTAANPTVGITYTDGTYVIKQAEASIVVNSLTVPYDGAKHSVTATVTGTVNGETLNYTLQNAQATSVGSTTVTVNYDPQDTVNANYKITTTPGTLTIEQTCGMRSGCRTSWSLTRTSVKLIRLATRQP
ncbi:hypothetical protein LPE01_17930 [Lactiplantibacillus pentosus]|nr:hypothetical protein LPE01_17930 [Lactiplantibacillus pentosus]